MWKVLLIWIALLVVGFFIAGVASKYRYENFAKLLTNILMWALILGCLGFLGLCMNVGGASCDYTGRGRFCEPG